MEDLWYIVQDGRSEGPIDLSELTARIRSGAVNGDTKSCRVGAVAWSRLRLDPTLAPLLREVSSPGAPSAVAPPTVPVASHASPGWTFEEGWRVTWKGFSRSWGSLLLLALVVIGLSLPGVVASQVLSVLMDLTEDPVVTLMLFVAMVVVDLINWLAVTIPMQSGLPYAASGASSGTIRVGDIFQPYRRIGMVLATGVVFSIGASLVCGICAAPGLVLLVIGMAVSAQSEGLALVLICAGIALMAVLVLAGTIFVLPYLYAPTVACDPAFGSPGFSDCFRLSAAGLKGRVFSVFAAMCVFFTISILTILLLCVGYLLVGVPLLIALNGAIYRLCVRARALDPKPG